jgi:exopolysaccharide biosynthesis WecB/TagA/CpsF family protein
LQTAVSSSAAFSLVEVSAVTREVLLDELGVRLEAGRGFGVATVNLDHLVKLQRDQGFRSAYLRHTHIVADGNPVVWLHRLAGRRVNLITGSDLIEPLMELAARCKAPVALLGSTEDALDVAAERLMARYSGLEIVTRIAPTFGFDPLGHEAQRTIAEIGASGARLCLVALGAPKQELFAACAMDLLPRCGFVSVGAGLDFLAGTQQRAPKWWRDMALEWAWRLARDRRRLARRYFDCLLILPGLIAAALRERLRSPIADAPEPGE